ncbi:MAG TPA: hypothetical protein VKZ18_14525 [Polyangia bacterium]|nr:hypothetical protein [Polyangia bacterium]
MERSPVTSSARRKFDWRLPGRRALTRDRITLALGLAALAALVGSVVLAP